MKPVPKPVLGVLIALVVLAIGLVISTPETTQRVGPASGTPINEETSDTIPIVTGNSDTAVVLRNITAPNPDVIDTLKRRSGLIIPVAGVKPKDLIDTYTAARSENRIHNALDIMAAKRTPVLAAVDGPIKRLFTSDKGGITLYQTDQDGLTVYYYAHLDAYAVGITEGKKLRQGEVLGYVGDTGNATSGNYHLHFAVWKITDPKNFWTGVDQNPYLLLRH